MLGAPSLVSSSLRDARVRIVSSASDAESGQPFRNDTAARTFGCSLVRRRRQTRGTRASQGIPCAARRSTRSWRRLVGAAYSYRTPFYLVILPGSLIEASATPMNSRRQFLIQAPVALLGAVAACRTEEQQPGAGGSTAAAPTPGAPPAFNTAPPVGPEVSTATFAEAEKLAQVSMTDAQRQMMARSWRTSMAALLERRTGPRKIALEPTLAPATRWQPASISIAASGPMIAAEPKSATRDRFVRSTIDPGPLPTNDADIAYAPVTQLA